MFGAALRKFFVLANHGPLPILGLAILATSIGLAADADAIVKRYIDANAANDERASRYTFVETSTHFTYDKSGTAKQNHSKTYEVLFLEGETYKKLIARDGQPLNAKDQSKEEKKLQLTAAERRKQRRSRMFQKRVSLGPASDLPRLFDSRLVGEEEIRGRKVWVIEATPKKGYVPADAKETDAMSFERKLWIDQSDDLPLKTLFTVVGTHTSFLPGLTVVWEYDKGNRDTWLPVTMTLDGKVQFNKLMKPRLRTVQEYSKYQKFNVESTITVDQQIPAEPKP